MIESSVTACEFEDDSTGLFSQQVQTEGLWLMANHSMKKHDRIVRAFCRMAREG